MSDRLPVALSSLNIVEGTAVFAVTQWVKEAADKAVSWDFGATQDIFVTARRELGLQPSAPSFVAVSTDPLKPTQARFPDALEKLGYTVERTDFRHNFVSVPGGPGEDRSDTPVLTVAPIISFLIGALAGSPHAKRQVPDILLVTGAFDYYQPLLQFTEMTGGHAAIAFFRPFLDFRWSKYGLFDSACPIQFYDLASHSKTIFGGVEIDSLITSVKTNRKTGISALFHDS